MVVLAEPYGQLSNRFFQHIHLDSFCKENGIKFYNSFIEEYANEYPEIPRIQPPIYVSWLVKIFAFSKIARKIACFNFRDESQMERYRLKILQSKWLFCYGFFFRNYETTNKYRSYYQKIFCPKINQSDNLIKEWLHKENKAQKLIAIHIRRGDYLHFEGGRYFYPDEVYLNMMQQANKLYEGNCRFIVFTNDSELDQNQYTRALGNQVRFSGHSVFVDHFLMSKCDLIIGPPSTVSLWASYLGEVLLFQIKERDDALSQNKFVICNG